MDFGIIFDLVVVEKLYIKRTFISFVPVKRISQLPRESRLSVSIRKLWQDSVDLSVLS